REVVLVRRQLRSLRAEQGGAPRRGRGSSASRDAPSPHPRLSQPNRRTDAPVTLTGASVRSGGSPPQTHRRSGSAEPRSGTQPFAETPQRVEQHPHEDRAGDADDDGQDGDET